MMLITVLLASTPTMVTHATDAPTADTPNVGGVHLIETTAASWPVYYDPRVPPSAIQNVVAAIELSVREIPRVTGLPSPSGTVVTYVLADRDQFRTAIAEHRGLIVDEVSDKANGYAMWRNGEMRIFLKMPEVGSPANAAGFVSHELAHVTFAEVAGFRPMTHWLNEGYAEIVRHEVVKADFPDAAEMLASLHTLGLASGIQVTGAALPWPSLVTSQRFSDLTRAGFGQMAYGQSALLVRLLLDRYGQSSVPDVFWAIGRGASPTAAFGEAFGAFGPHGEAFDAAIANLPARYPPGLYRLAQHARADGIPSLAIVAGAPGEPATVEIYEDGALVEQQQLTLDPAGFGRIAFSDAVRTGDVVVRVVTASLGRLEIALVIEPAAQFRQNAAPASAPTTGPQSAPIQSPAPRPAPAQIPGTGGLFTPPVHERLEPLQAAYRSSASAAIG
jgi:hypothetical protein